MDGQALQLWQWDTETAAGAAGAAGASEAAGEVSARPPVFTPVQFCFVKGEGCTTCAYGSCAVVRHCIHLLCGRLPRSAPIPTPYRKWSGFTHSAASNSATVWRQVTEAAAVAASAAAAGAAAGLAAAGMAAAAAAAACPSSAAGGAGGAGAAGVAGAAA